MNTTLPDLLNYKDFVAVRECELPEGTFVIPFLDVESAEEVLQELSVGIQKPYRGGYIPLGAERNPNFGCLVHRDNLPILS